MEWYRTIFCCVCNWILGDVILENLQIRKKGLNNLGLPIKLKSGFVGKLQLKVPWHNLKNAPIIVKLKDIFLIAQSKPESEVINTHKTFDLINSGMKKIMKTNNRPKSKIN